MAPARTARSLLIALTALSLLLVGLAPAGAARLHDPPPAEVRVAAIANIGAGGSAVIEAWVRCRDGALVQELVLEVSQPEASGTRAGDFGIVCDGGWHAVLVEVPAVTADPFRPGPADVLAFFTVLDPVTMDPLRQGQDARTVWILAPARVAVGRHGELDAAGQATLDVWARCRAPWVVATLSVELFQGEDQGSGNTDDFFLACDGRWFHREVRVVPAPGTFEPGSAWARASFAILDPSTGDPLFTATSARRVWLTGAVAPVLWDQTGSRIGARASADLPGDELDSQGADDFVVPPGQVWSISEVFAPGSNASTHPEPFLVPGVHVVVYADGGDEPGSPIASYASVPPTTAPDDLTIPLAPALVLPAGTYWISVQADLSALTIGDAWGWAFRGTPTGATGVWRNPGGGLGGGQDWTPERDFEFDLRGTSTAA